VRKGACGCISSRFSPADLSVEWWIEEARSELLLALALTAKENAAVRIRISFDPFDPAATRQKFLDGFLARGCRDIRHGATSFLIASWYGPPLT
jgi:hypothetical protein